MSPLSIFPPRASAMATEVDHLYTFLVVVSAFMTILIFAAVTFAAVRYRRSRRPLNPKPILGSIPLEVAWSTIPFLVMLVMFGWGAKLYVQQYTVPEDAMNIEVVGKQWMWKLQHEGGQSEINELHVPMGRTVRLNLMSEDVIHSFFIPAFRLKHDVVPGRTQSIWFEATEPGRYHLFCAEYCGTNHSEMTGWVTVMQPAEYENWLAGRDANSSGPARGQALFASLGCANCHLGQQTRCPPMTGVYGSQVVLSDGRTVVANDAYVRESILQPNAKIVKGYEPNVMPSFDGQVNDSDIQSLTAYIKSLSGGPSAPPTPQRGATTTNTGKNAAGKKQ